ncbi:cysteine proteinase [Sparassis crispa]|uniref:ubiquitinyl hydrolase 1 n=1 Tax=Sparassis crispa TaxID=139825 RepID=A0A401GXG3_9APHY|nr:cysteine proteinase [Sparassis crispa]GBE86464.1 cysteine proteinase [Sparassis crispa]
MQSDPSSSSPKRSISEDPAQDSIRTSQFQEMSALSLSESGLDHEIDSYMAEQGETPDPSNHVAFLTPAQKLQAVEPLYKSPMKIGETWYVVSRRWYKRWHKACSGEVDKEGPVAEKDLGPVDNSPLVDVAGNLTSPSMVEHVDVEFVPEQVWMLFVEWYGEPPFPLPRKVIARGIIEEPSLELHPPQVKLYVLTRATHTGVPGVTNPPYGVSISIKDTLKSVCESFFQRCTECASGTKSYRVWKLADGGSSWGQLHVTPDMLKQRGATLLEPTQRTVEEEMIESGDAFVVEFREDGEWLVDAGELSSGQTSTASSSTSQSTSTTGIGTLFNSETNFFNQIQTKTPASTIVSSGISSSSTLKPAVSIKPGFSAGRPKDINLEPGILGLGNMGNTCFMNSALQCLAHSKELTDYFLTGVFEEELNVDNPLGMQGAIAQAYGALLRRIWTPTSSNTSYSPREFKQALQRFAPQFSGYQQQDSQELVAFLLDGLHEDLNRVLKKPYVEKPDWEGGGNLELVRLANESWDGYMKRNDSVIVDLFQGQYQSTLVCPECDKVSITFDPFMYLTLPLPVQKKWMHTVFYIPWGLDKPHVKVPVEINRDASFKDLRQLLGRWMSANPDHLLTLEVFSHRFYKNLDDTVLCGDMAENDIIVCFELPCHSQQSRTYKHRSDDPFIVPVFLNDFIPRQSFGRSTSLFGYPFIIVIDRKQATMVDDMYDAVVDRLQRWTTNIRDLFTWEAVSVSEQVDIPIADSLDAIVHIPITGPPDSITEIKENGEVVTVEEVAPEEGDIADEKEAVVRGQDLDAMDTDSVNDINEEPRKVGFKKGLFRLRLQSGNSPYGVGFGSFGLTGQRFDSWEHRESVARMEPDASSPPVLLREGDMFFCEFDENMKAYYFGDEKNHPWDTWKEFIHPEFREAAQAAALKKNKGISLQDCLDEFTRQEKLGEDDLWYCPRCKKHQQATKRFDLWKVPDMLVVHLKRFSNSRTLRDKIDTFVDFPIQGLDLSQMVGERQVAKKLMEEGIDILSLGLHDLEEPLIYDLYAVDEHLGGLGGGHYRAYALNHRNGQWYHFDDSYVTPSRAEAAVNANAYLLFYKRRTSRPLGGKSYARVEAAKSKPKSLESVQQEQSQLPTPPDEPIVKSAFESQPQFASLKRAATERFTSLPIRRQYEDGWPTPQSDSRSSPDSSPPPLDDGDPPPSFEESQSPTSLDALALSAHQLDYPDPSSRGSPTSSNEAEPDLELELGQENENMSWTSVLSSGGALHDVLQLTNVALPGEPSDVIMNNYLRSVDDEREDTLDSPRASWSSTRKTADGDLSDIDM